MRLHINQLNTLYYCQSVSLPGAYEISHKERPVVDTKTGKTRFMSQYSEHQMLRQCLINGLSFKYILGEHRPISELFIDPHQTRVVWLKGVDFPLTLVKQVLKPGRRSGRELAIRGVVSGE